MGMISSGSDFRPRLVPLLSEGAQVLLSRSCPSSGWFFPPGNFDGEVSPWHKQSRRVDPYLNGEEAGSPSPLSLVAINGTWNQTSRSPLVTPSPNSKGPGDLSCSKDLQGFENQRFAILGRDYKWTKKRKTNFGAD